MSEEDKSFIDCQPMCSKNAGRGSISSLTSAEKKKSNSPTNVNTNTNANSYSSDQTPNSNSNSNPSPSTNPSPNPNPNAGKFIPLIVGKNQAPTILITSNNENKRSTQRDSNNDEDDNAFKEDDELLTSNTHQNALVHLNADPQLTISSLRSLGLLANKNSDEGGGYPYGWNAFALSDPDVQQTVKSIASLGLGSSDGRNLYVRRVPSSASILINSKGATIRRSAENDDDDSSSGSSSFSVDHDSGYRFRRKHWRNKAEFILACIGFTVGLGNIYRFPYLAYKSGGGAFLVPYFVTLIFCAIPLLYMELSIGQFTRRGPVGAMSKICPLFKGTGVATLLISFVMSTYSVVVIAWALYYLVASFNPTLPWQGCGNEWNTPGCFNPFNISKADEKSIQLFNRSSVTQEFYDGKVLQRSVGIEDPGELRGELVLCLFCAWILVYFVLWKSVRSSGKVVYITATFPYILIIAFMVFALTLPGADEGLRFFFKPKWDLLLDAKVWINAAAQNFNALGIAMGAIMTFSSYNRFSNNILTDTICIGMINAIASILVGITVFSMLGNLALEQKTTIEDVVSDGPGLVFVVYPQVFMKMPVPHIWAILFFFMLLCVALDNEFAMVEVVITAIRDGFPKMVARYFKRHEILVLLVVVISFLLGLPNTLQGGIYIFQLLDDYAAKFSLMYLAFFETLAVIWIYGVPRLSRNIAEMTGSKPSMYFIFCWRFAAPVLILVVWIFSFIDYEKPTYDNGKYSYPWWAEAFGWILASSSLVTIPIFAILQLRKSTGSTFLEKLRSSMKSTMSECPLCGYTRSCTHDVNFDNDSEWNLHGRNSIKTTNLTPIIVSDSVFEKVSTL